MTTPDIAGLCERLRMRAAARLSLKRPSKTDRADAEIDIISADTLERQAAEIERLRGALEKQAAQMNFLARMADGRRRCERGKGPATWMTTVNAIRSEAVVGEVAARAALTGEDAGGKG